MSKRLIFSCSSPSHHEARNATYPFGCGLSMERTSQNPSPIGGIKEAQSNTSRKPLTNFSFKPVIVDLISPPQSIPSTSKDSLLGFERFIVRNPFDLRTNPSTFSSLPPSFSSSFPSSFLLLSNPFLTKNLCYNFCSSSPSTLEPKLPRPLLMASLLLPWALRKLSYVDEPAVAPSSTASFDFSAILYG